MLKIVFLKIVKHNHTVLINNMIHNMMKFEMDLFEALEDNFFANNNFSNKFLLTVQLEELKKKVEKKYKKYDKHRKIKK
jgi:hypothetical protein